MMKTTLNGTGLVLALLLSCNVYAVNIVTIVSEEWGPGKPISTQFQPDRDGEGSPSALSWQEVGRGEMSVLWFNLYQASLLTPTGEYRQGDYPLKLDIRYQRDIEADDLVNATVEQWQHLNFSEQQILVWQQELLGLWPDVTDGERLAFECLSADSGNFYFNGELLGNVSSPGFAQAFLAIWLSENTSRPDLRAQLMGDKSCDC